jgi:hypothetical protein
MRVTEFDTVEDVMHDDPATIRIFLVRLPVSDVRCLFTASPMRAASTGRMWNVLSALYARCIRRMKIHVLRRVGQQEQLVRVANDDCRPLSTRPSCPNRSVRLTVCSVVPVISATSCRLIRNSIRYAIDLATGLFSESEQRVDDTLLIAWSTSRSRR